MKVKDKLAIVFHGIVGGMVNRNGIGAPPNISDCFKTIKNSFSEYDYDIFVHSWSTEHEKSIISLYKPKDCLFQPQEYFGYSQLQVSAQEVPGQAYRTMSRYTSLERAMKLKDEYEKEYNFKYKWVVALRFDLVFFNRTNLNSLNPNNFYICSEPHWPGPPRRIIHDIIFLSNSDLMSDYSKLAEDIRNKKYDPSDTHKIAYTKLCNILNNDTSMIIYGFDRYKDIEIYRMVMNPKLNPVGHAYGALEVRDKLNKLLEKIDNG